jgi:hypothetical protein
MTHSNDTPGSRKNIADHGGVVYSGKFSGQIATATGRDGIAVNASTGMQERLINELRDQLSDARRLLNENHDPGRTASREDAIADIDSVDRELADRREVRDAGRLRRRLERLAVTLIPVADIIGGAAALLEIINELKSII